MNIFQKEKESNMKEIQKNNINDPISIDQNKVI
jgi:hypothetical protein